MFLKCKAICTNVYKKSSSPAFTNLQIGDVIDFSIEIKSVGFARGGSHAAYILCINKRTGLQSKLSFNQIEKVLSNFEFKELN